MRLITELRLSAINLTYTLVIADALFGASNLPVLKNPAFLRKIEPNTLAAMMLTLLTSRIISMRSMQQRQLSRYKV